MSSLWIRIYYIGSPLITPPGGEITLSPHHCSNEEHRTIRVLLPHVCLIDNKRTLLMGVQQINYVAMAADAACLWLGA